MEQEYRDITREEAQELYELGARPEVKISIAPSKDMWYSPHSPPSYYLCWDHCQWRVPVE